MQGQFSVLTSISSFNPGAQLCGAGFTVLPTAQAKKLGQAVKQRAQGHTAGFEPSAQAQTWLCHLPGKPLSLQAFGPAFVAQVPLRALPGWQGPHHLCEAVCLVIKHPDLRLRLRP